MFLAAFLLLAQVVEVLPEPVTLLCTADGSTSETFPAEGGNYELVAPEDLHVCMGAETCATGGDPRPKGNHGIQFVKAKTKFSCRSASGTAEVHFIRVKVAR